MRDIIRFITLIQYSIILTSCSDDGNKYSSSAPISMEFQSKYSAWKARCDAMPPYSKTAPYTNLPEFQEIIKLGKSAIPELKKKIQEDNGLDFVLSVAVIEIMGWDKTEFHQRDMTTLRNKTLLKLSKTEKY